MEIDIPQEDLDRLGIKLEEGSEEAAVEAEEGKTKEPEAATVTTDAATEPATQAETDYAKELEEIRKQLAELKPAERHPAEAEPPPDAEQPKETEEQQSSRLAKELADELGEDADVVPKLAQKVVSIASKLGSQVEQLAKKQRDVDARQARLDAIETNQRYWAAVKEEHADIEDLVDTSGNTAKGKLAEWINSQPDGMRGVFGNIVSNGTVKELSALLELAKKSFTVVKAAPATTEDLLAKKAVVEQRLAELKGKKGSSPSVSEAPPASADRPLHEKVSDADDPVGVIRALVGNDPAKFRKTAENLLFD